MANFYSYMDYGMGWHPSSFGVVGGMFFGLGMLIMVIWTLYWKFHALWYAAKHDDKLWFIALLIINSLGILEILYLYIFSKKMGTPAHDESQVPMVK